MSPILSRLSENLLKQTGHHGGKSLESEIRFFIHGVAAAQTTGKSSKVVYQVTMK
jgi:hypothetical protein